MKFSERLAEENANFARDFEARFLEKDELASKLKKDVVAYEKNCRELKELILLLEQRHSTCQVLKNIKGFFEIIFKTFPLGNCQRNREWP